MASDAIFLRAFLCRRMPLALVFFSLSIAVWGQSEPATARQDDFRTIHETTIFEKLGNWRSDWAYRLVMSVSDDQLLITDAANAGADYTLGDGTVIVRNRASEQEIFVSQVIEHRTADKTVILMPSVHTDVGRAFEKLLALQAIADKNPGKSFEVLLEGFDSGGDNLDDFYAIRNRHPVLNYKRLVTDPYAYYTGIDIYRAAVSASMALFYANPEVRLDGLESRGILSSLGKNRRSEFIGAAASRNEETAEDLDMMVRNYFESRLRNFAFEFESAVSAAVESRNLNDASSIRRLNEMQIALADMLQAPNFKDRMFIGQDQRVKDLLAQMDVVSGADTSGAYGRFSRSMFAFKEVVEQVRAAAKQDPDLSADGSMKAELVADVFSHLPKGSVAVCELSADRIDEQILICLKRATYNMVIFDVPFPDGVSVAVPHDQNPEEHVNAIEKILPEMSIPGVFLPVNIKNRFTGNQEISQALDRRLMLFSGAYRDLDPAASEQQLLVHYFPTTLTGGILRITGLPEENDVYYFLPGIDIVNQSKGVANAYRNEDIPALHRAVLEKWAQAIRASLGL